jgi:hypothetical protein
MMDRLELDYEQTGQVFRLFADIRFKLLALVPAIAGVGTALAGKDGVKPEVQLALGLLGLVATLGILLYELRNSELYNWAIHRAKHLERELGLSVSALGAPQGGVFGERVPAHHRFLGMVLIKHDPALGLVYGSALGAWTWVAASGLLTLITGWSDRDVFWVALAGAVAMGSLIACEVYRHDRRQRLPKAVGRVDHFVAALREVRADLHREAGTPTTKESRQERELEQLVVRTERILEMAPPTEDSRNALRAEVTALQQVLSTLGHPAVGRAQARCRELLNVQDAGEPPSEQRTSART